MTIHKIAIGAAVLLGSWLLFGGESKAAKQPPAKPAPTPPAPPNDMSVAVGAGYSDGLVGTISYQPDGSVIECEQNFWTGTPKLCKRFTAAEWAAKESAINAALDRGIADSPLYSLATYNVGTVV